MARSPYLLKDGSHILSAFGSRTGTAVKVWELRFNLNGWKAQHLIHNAANFVDVKAEDLGLYATDRKIKAVSHAVDSVLATIRGSKPFGLVRAFDGRTSVTSSSEGLCQGVTTAALQSLASACEALAQNKGVFAPVLHYPGAVNEATIATGVWSRWSADASVNPRVITDKLRETKGFDLDTSCFDDPIGRFKQMVADHLRIPMQYVVFVGRGYPTDFAKTTAPEWTQYVDKPYAAKGFTVIYSPRDLQGAHGIFVVPKIPGVRAVIIASRLGYLTQMPQAVSYAGTSIDGAILDASGVVPGRASSATTGMTAKYEKAYNSVYVVPDTAPVTGALTPVMAGIDSGAFESMGRPALKCKGSDGTWGSYVDGCDLSYIRFDGLFYAVPNGFGSIYLDAPGVATVATDAAYGSVLGVQPVKINATLKMQSVRAYMLAKSKTAGLSPVDKQALEKGLKDSEPYADALLYCTVYNNGWEFPTKDAISKLGIVKAASEADKDLMTEDLGQGETLTKVASKFEKQRLKGNRAFAAVTMVDGALKAEDVVSPFLADRFHPWLWNVKPVLTDGAIAAYRGAYAGGMDEAITADDALSLVCSNAKVTLPSGLTIAEVYVDLGIEESKLGAFGVMFSPALPGNGTRAYDGMTSLPMIAMAPNDFRDVLGFPVLNILDDDSRYRAMVVLKGLGEDLQGMFLTLFFLNELDFK